MLQLTYVLKSGQTESGRWGAGMEGCLVSTGFGCSGCCHYCNSYLWISNQAMSRSLFICWGPNWLTSVKPFQSLISSQIWSCSQMDACISILHHSKNDPRSVYAWEVGCILASFYLDNNLLQVSEENQGETMLNDQWCDSSVQMKYMIGVLGQPEDHLLHAREYTQHCFCAIGTFKYCP